MLTSTPWRIAAAVLLVRIDVMQRHARTMPGTTPIKVIPISRDRERPVHTGSGLVDLGDDWLTAHGRDPRQRSHSPTPPRSIRAGSEGLPTPLWVESVEAQEVVLDGQH